MCNNVYPIWTESGLKSGLKMNLRQFLAHFRAVLREGYVQGHHYFQFNRYSITSSITCQNKMYSLPPEVGQKKLRIST